MRDPSQGSLLMLVPPGWGLPTEPQEPAFCRVGVAPCPLREGWWCPRQSALGVTGCLSGACTQEEKRTPVGVGDAASLPGLVPAAGKRASHKSPHCARSQLNSRYCNTIMDNLHIASLLYRLHSFFVFILPGNKVFLQSLFFAFKEFMVNSLLPYR